MTRWKKSGSKLPECYEQRFHKLAEDRDALFHQMESVIDEIAQAASQSAEFNVIEVDFSPSGEVNVTEVALPYSASDDEKQKEEEEDSVVEHLSAVFAAVQAR
jgi:hypothetical protein